MTAAVVGLGVIGSHHINVLQNLGINICAVCDIDEEKARNYPNYNQLHKNSVYQILNH